ncbi:TetR/AcrR family transcriptional regulator C-terminal domain-containing protein [Kitasatospora aureofaciens]|uniref:TetR/AcrR family transcriptional regulator C-terminal domain-containing protein n=1 Tax=Kitasatospora aureofaciens TaxID=1894 RepID=UPI001C46DF68|nr:TetR/AcrR family transcriptional regulator C-terminal domain-containing protein [Kitasatospora aureofaciens]MBV6699782.1 TetR/AcrR family transcriptional regulator C-terminal domain-containing protein [Kitasatospora aureofaciens]
MPSRRARPRTGLTREKVIDAALAFVDEHGLAALSNRKLGAALGVEGMTLYYYVPSKAAMLDGMVERLLELSAGDLFAEPAGQWTDVVREFAVALRRMLLDHPAMLTVLATRPAATPAALALLERGITVLREDGVPLGDALDVLNAVVSFTLGHTLAEAGETPGHEGTEPDPGQFSTLDPATYPQLAEALGTGTGLDAEARFHRTLHILLAGFAAELDGAR